MVASFSSSQLVQEQAFSISSLYQLTSDQLAQYHRDGFLIVRGLFGADEIEPLQQSLVTHSQIYDSGEIHAHSSGDSFSIMYLAETGNSLLGMFPRISRIVEGAEALLGEPCYHWHSKVCRKLPQSGEVEWHQDYGSWYYNGCLSPQLITCAIAIEHCTNDNGCLQVIKGSHLLGRIDVVDKGNTVITEPERVQLALEQMETVHCEMEPGDAIFFHSNILHGSPQNLSDRSRAMMFCTYNAISNAPFIKEGQEHHQYTPLAKVPNSAIRNGDYQSLLDIESELHKANPDNGVPHMNIRGCQCECM